MRHTGRSVTLIDPIKSRRKRAAQLGFLPSQICLSVESLAFESQPLVVDAAGDFESASPAFIQAQSLAKRGGTIVGVGKYSNVKAVDCSLAARRGMNVIWIRGATHRDLESAIATWRQSIAVIADVIVTHRYSISDVNAAFETARDRNTSGKVIVQWCD
jgi:threonine dehydrogenase-like Zn-dependent dehydrogenase